MSIFPSLVTAAASAAKPEDAGTASSTSSSSSSTGSATVTANDFLQLLVTEMKNQDPTADTDPNQYIDQLVQVNSLQQLIQINQDLAPLGSSTTSSGDNAQPGLSHGNPAARPAASTAAPGNLSPPANSAAASRIANTLGAAAQTLAPGASSSPLESTLSALKARMQQARTSITSNPAH